MSIVKFSEVAHRAYTREDRFNTEKIYYVGGEHIDSCELYVTKKGVIKGSTIGPMFYCGFTAGQILFVTRNPHLKKCSIADFDGICSEKTFVIETKDESILTQEYLAIIMQSDDFWNYCEENKSGGVNYFLNWSTLADYEFELPPIKQQLEIAQKVMSAYRLKQSYKKLLDATREMVKSQFIEMYYNTHNKQTLESVCPIMSKGITPKYVESSSVLVINQACIHWDGQRLGNIKYHNEEIPVRKRILESGDVLLNATGNGTLGRCCVFICPSDNNTYINDGHVIALSTDRAVILPEVLNTYLSLNDTQAEIYRQYVTGSTNQVDIVFSDIKKMKVPVPSMDEQILFVEVLKQADKSKFGDFKSQFIEMFGNPVTNTKGWKTAKIKDVAPEMPSKEQLSGKIWLLNLDMIESNTGRIIEKVYEDVENALSVQSFDEGNVLFSKLRPYLNKVVIPDEPGMATTELVPLRPEPSKLHKVFLSHLLRGNQFVNYANDIAGGTKMPRMPLTELRNFDCILPPMDKQLEFVFIAEQVDKSKFELKQCIEHIDKVIKSLING